MNFRCYVKQKTWFSQVVRLYVLEAHWTSPWSQIIANLGRWPHHWWLCGSSWPPTIVVRRRTSVRWIEGTHWWLRRYGGRSSQIILRRNGSGRRGRARWRGYDPHMSRICRIHAHVGWQASTKVNRRRNCLFLFSK